MKKGRTIRTKVFKFSELSETAKEKANYSLQSALKNGQIFKDITQAEFYQDGTLYNGK